MHFQINRSGDTPELLLAEFRAVLEATQALNAALVAAMPRGRNYQTVPGGEALAQVDRAEVRRWRVQLLDLQDWATNAGLRVIAQQNELEAGRN